MSDGSASDTSEEHSEDTTWVTWFCSIKGNEFFCEVDEEYLIDNFNLSGLKDEVGSYYDEAMDTILDTEAQSDYNEDHQAQVDNAAEFLYGLIHARFILTAKGLQVMNEKFMNCDFGRCHNVRCDGQALLPVGLHDAPRKSYVCLFCPRCTSVFYPRSSRHSNIDGAYFGSTFPHLLLLCHPPPKPLAPLAPYVPKIFGFRVWGGGDRTGGGGGGGDGEGGPARLPRGPLTTVLARDEKGRLIAPDGAALVVNDEDFYDLDELRAQAGSSPRRR